MVLTDNELAMIEQLTYLDNEVMEAADLDGFDGFNTQKGQSIEKILACFDEKALEALEKEESEIKGACMSGKEWADLIRALQNSRMKDLELQSTMPGSEGTTLALCFVENGNTSDAIVAFKGTSGEEEWKDNVEGLILSDTPRQKEALDYIESLPYDSITVTGHSKGGNKAMYVAITSSKVDRCVALDAQGFSTEFLDKYWAEILQKGEIITNYSLGTDYVHPLMLQIPNANQVYCEGYGIDNFKQHHSPNSFFLTDEEGNLLLDENGNVIIKPAEGGESGVVKFLHQFTAFLMYNASDEDKNVMVEFLGELLAMTMGGGDTSPLEITGYVLKNTDALATLVAYLIKYTDEHVMEAVDLEAVFEALGLRSIFGAIRLSTYAMSLNPIGALLAVVGIGVADFMAKVNQKIDEIDASGGCADPQLKCDTIRNFSLATYSALMSTIGRIEQIGAVSLHTWGNYAYEEWYSILPVGAARNGINLYFAKLSETNQSCKTNIDAIFDQVEKIDTEKSNRILMRYYQLQSMNNSILSVANSIVG